MKVSYISSFVLASALTFTGCATKKYVNTTVSTTTAPIKSQVDQVQAQTDEQKKQLEQHDTRINANNERATAADQRAGDAMNRADSAGQRADAAGQKADTANQKADRNTTDISGLRDVVANLDDYKPVKDVVVPFGFNKDGLTPDAKQMLDELVTEKSTFKRYFIAVEGFTDKTGSADYNAALSRRRADRVVQYLVAQHDVPIYRIHMIGLGAQKPADDGKGRTTNAKNRRVEVTIYSADQNVTAMNSPTASNQ